MHIPEEDCGILSYRLSDVARRRIRPTWELLIKYQYGIGMWCGVTLLWCGWRDNISSSVRNSLPVTLSPGIVSVINWNLIISRRVIIHASPNHGWPSSSTTSRKFSLTLLPKGILRTNFSPQSFYDRNLWIIHGTFSIDLFTIVYE